MQGLQYKTNYFPARYLVAGNLIAGSSFITRLEAFMELKGSSWNSPLTFLYGLLENQDCN